MNSNLSFELNHHIGIPTPSSGMDCCKCPVASDATPATPKKTNIYGTDLSKVETSRIIQKTVISGNNQALSIKGKGYEFEPIIVVAAKNVTTFLSVDLNEFDNPTGTFEIAHEFICNFNKLKSHVKVELSITLLT